MRSLSQILVSAALAFAAVGQTAPEFSAKTLSGERISLSSIKGKVVVIHFWATWCKPCMLEMPAFSEYYKKHQHDGLIVLAVSMDKDADIEKAREMSKAFPFPIALNKDSDFRKFGRIWHMPMTFLIDRKGILREDDWNGEGKKGIDGAALEKTVTPLLKK
jgi:cytochrome c biogenesis protein CcmG, thiol:disulfide interchange protein DsbE